MNRTTLLLCALLLLSACAQVPDTTTGALVEYAPEPGMVIDDLTCDDCAQPPADEFVVDGTDRTPAAGGAILVDATSQYRSFDAASYAAALAEGKTVVLYFYAQWCPACVEEQPRIEAAFAQLDDPNVIGFRVNYKDRDTDADEEALAREFGIAYQHTKVIIKDGVQVLKAPDTWDTERYLREIRAVTNG